MGFWVYILLCSDGSYYTGHTDDLEKRVAMHNSGEVKGYTMKRLPVKLVFTEELSSREDALIAERRIKGWNRRKSKPL